MKSVARRVSDRHLLHLIKMWLVAPVEETDERGHDASNDPQQGRRRGTPQGAPISPLLSNLYMRRFVLGWKALGHEKRLACSDRQLRRRLRDLLSSRTGRRGHDGDAGHDGAAEADGQRAEDATVPAAGGDVRLSGLHVRPAYSTADGPGLLRTPPVARRRSSGCSPDSRGDQRVRWLWLDRRTRRP